MKTLVREFEMSMSVLQTSNSGTSEIVERMAGGNTRSSDQEVYNTETMQAQS